MSLAILQTYSYFIIFNVIVKKYFLNFALGISLIEIHIPRNTYDYIHIFIHSSTAGLYIKRISSIWLNAY